MNRLLQNMSFYWGKRQKSLQTICLGFRNLSNFFSFYGMLSNPRHTCSISGSADKDYKLNIIYKKNIIMTIRLYLIYSYLG